MCCKCRKMWVWACFEWAIPLVKFYRNTLKGREGHRWLRENLFLPFYISMSFNLPKRAKRLRQRDPEEEEAKKLAKKSQAQDTEVQGILDRKKQRREMDKELERVGVVNRRADRYTKLTTMRI